jgi:hypothetical protein
VIGISVTPSCIYGSKRRLLKGGDGFSTMEGPDFGLRRIVRRNFRLLQKSI